MGSGSSSSGGGEAAAPPAPAVAPYRMSDQDQQYMQMTNSLGKGISGAGQAFAGGNFPTNTYAFNPPSQQGRPDLNALPPFRSSLLAGTRMPMQ